MELENKVTDLAALKKQPPLICKKPPCKDCGIGVDEDEMQLHSQWCHVWQKWHDVDWSFMIGINADGSKIA